MKAFDVASEEYRKVLQQQHAMSDWGKHGASHMKDVWEFANELKATSILDYGCGKGTLKTAIGNAIAVTEYDPGIVGKDALPEPADLLVAFDVMEHIEPALLGTVLDHIVSLARKGMLLVIANDVARLTLPDGRNAHLIQQPFAWWLIQLRKHGIKVARTEKRKGLYVWVTV